MLSQGACCRALLPPAAAVNPHTHMRVNIRPHTHAVPHVQACPRLLWRQVPGGEWGPGGTLAHACLQHNFVCSWRTRQAPCTRCQPPITASPLIPHPQVSHHVLPGRQPLFWGDGVFADPGLLPLARPLTTVVGAPIPVRAWEGPCEGPEWDAAVGALHARYVAELQALWRGWREKVDPDRVHADLTIIG